MTTLTQGCVSRLYQKNSHLWMGAPTIQLIKLEAVASADPNAAEEVK